jgi:hypothetical protein
MYSHHNARRGAVFAAAWGEKAEESMRIHVIAAMLGMTTAAACSSSLCDETWSPEREQLIRSNICNQNNLDAIESDLGDMNLAAIDGTSIVIDTDTGRIVRVPGAIDGPDESRLAPVDVNVAGAEELRPATATPAALEIVNGIGFVTVNHTNAPDEAVLVANSIKFGATYVRVIGSRPLTLVSSLVAVEGIIDVAAGCPDDPGSMVCGGPGGGEGAVLDQVDVAAGCAPGGNGTGGNGEDTGGGGGGFGGAGGSGGATLAELSDGSIIEREGGPGGDIAACPGEVLARFEGGSGGGYGEGYLDGAPGGGNGGGGGGALRILASSEIRMGPQNTPVPRVAGVWAGGGGGQTAFDPNAGTGGGGGGAGGAILLEAPSITLSDVILAANGGSGASGGLSGEAPENGVYGTFSAIPAAGAGEGVHAGGAGGALDSPAQAAASTLADQVDGTGGGGGGAGIIRINTRSGGLVQTETSISPAPSTGAL